jgi:hypothetical protein
MHLIAAPVTTNETHAVCRGDCAMLAEARRAGACGASAVGVRASGPPPRQQAEAPKVGYGERHAVAVPTTAAGAALATAGAASCSSAAAAAAACTALSAACAAAGRAATPATAAATTAAAPASPGGGGGAAAPRRGCRAG